jgi:hypothetical protein
VVLALYSGISSVQSLLALGQCRSGASCSTVPNWAVLQLGQSRCGASSSTMPNWVILLVKMKFGCGIEAWSVVVAVYSGSASIVVV